MRCKAATSMRQWALIAEALPSVLFPMRSPSVESVANLGCDTQWSLRAEEWGCADRHSGRRRHKPAWRRPQHCRASQRNTSRGPCGVNVCRGVSMFPRFCKIARADAAHMDMRSGAVRAHRHASLAKELQTRRRGNYWGQVAKIALWPRLRSPPYGVPTFRPKCVDAPSPLKLPAPSCADPHVPSVVHLRARRPGRIDPAACRMLPKTEQTRSNATCVLVCAAGPRNPEVQSV